MRAIVLSLAVCAVSAASVGFIIADAIICLRHVAVVLQPDLDFVVVVRDIASRAVRRIELRQSAIEIAQQPLCARPERRPGADASIEHDASTSAIEPCSMTTVPSM